MQESVKLKISNTLKQKGIKPPSFRGKRHSEATLIKMRKPRRKGINYSQKELLRNQRKAVLEALGGKCVQCEFSDKRALQIDHINGGGSKERKERTYKGNFHKHVLQSFLNGENKYQLLCANCNWIKRVENNESRYK